MLKNLIPAIAILVAFSGPFSAHADQGAIQVTIAGNITNTNRGPRNEFGDAFHVYHGKEFERAFSLDRYLLQSLPQVSITVDADKWPDSVELKGPKLDDVLSLAGATGKSISVTALDGYELEISTNEIAAHEWVLAISANDKPLAIGGRGPTWLVYGIEGRKASDEEEAKWVWSAFFIEVK